MLSVRFLAINDVIMTSLLLLKSIYVLANFLTPYSTILFTYFALSVNFEGNLDFTNKFNNIAS